MYVEYNKVHKKDKPNVHEYQGSWSDCAYQ